MVCHLLGSGFNYIIQIALGGIATSILYFKYRRENPRRPLGIWIKDTSKQIIGMAWSHIINLMLAIRLTAKDEDQCVSYFINYIIDSSLGVALNLLILLGTRKLGQRYNLPALDSGNYEQYSPENFSLDDPISFWKRWRLWVYQVGVWLTIITIIKVIIFFGFIFPAETPLLVAGSTILHGLTNDDQWELVIVMVIVPLIIITSQFLIQDACFKHPPPRLDADLDDYLMSNPQAYPYLYPYGSSELDHDPQIETTIIKLSPINRPKQQHQVGSSDLGTVDL